MAEQHREDDNNNASSAWWQPQRQTLTDEHYDNTEHRPQRRRLRSPTMDPFMPIPGRYAGDGLDYRRPVMTAQNMGWQADSGMRQQQLEQDVRQAAGRDIEEYMVRARGSEQPASATETIDLTGEGDAEEALPRDGLSRADNAGPSRAAQRLPRFERNIIDIDSSDDEQPAPQAQHSPDIPAFEDDDNESLFIPQAPQRSYPQNFAPLGPRRTVSGLRHPGFIRQPSPAMPLDDVEVVGSRPISRVQSRRQTPNLMQSQRSITPFPGENGNTTIDLTQDDDDDLVFTHSRARPGVNGDRPAMAGTGAGVRDEPELYGGRGIAHLAQVLRRHGRELPGFANAFLDPVEGDAVRRQAEIRLAQAHQRTLNAENQLEALRNRLQSQHRHEERLMNRHPVRAPPRMPTALPGMMDLGSVGFDLGFGIPRPPTPKYEPPQPAEEGFTRNPEEEEVVVCPNCGDELAMGDKDVKQQVWVVKACGHVSLTGTNTFAYIVLTSV